MSPPMQELVAWGESPEACLERLDVTAEAGLSSREITARRRVWGANQFRPAARRSAVSILVDQFRSIVILLLAGAGLLALAFSEVPEAIAIFVVIGINTAIGFVTEWRAVRSMEALRQFAQVECVVVREGTVVRIPASELVPGDIVVLEAGDLVPADLRVIEASKLSADESTLTGESLPVDKTTDVLPQDTPLLDRNNMLHKGTAVTRGAGRGVVTSTGTQTEFGKIFEQVSTAESVRTPLEKRLDALGERLVKAVIVIAVVVAVAGILAGRDAFVAIEVAIALSVAAIPEGLPIVATIALARGMWRMARRNALITKLSAVEALGATSVILTDKTGTLTENRMSVTMVLLDGVDVEAEQTHLAGTGEFHSGGAPLDAGTESLLDALLRATVLCDNAVLQRATAEQGAIGDPTEAALLVAASARDLWHEEEVGRAPEVREDPFDPDSKRMATVHSVDGQFYVAVKGAPETVLDSCSRVQGSDGERDLSSHDRKAWQERVEAVGARGLRTLAVAAKHMPQVDGDLYADLVLLGVVGLEDPAREGVVTALGSCRGAGVTVVMVTGDHAATALNIARETGIVAAEQGVERLIEGRELDELLEQGRDDDLLHARVFSRVTPEQKLKLIDLYQRQGRVVAMTGDGVNDAPALRKADIGVAMGLRGTAVAKEAAEMVLQDDEFGTIVAAIGHGRIIFENIRKFVVYLLSCNISEVLIVSLATLAGAPLPLLPLQILFLNLVTDVFPALALGVGGASRTLMRARPRRADENILTRRHWLQIGLHGTVMAVTVLAAMAIAYFNMGLDRERAVTVSFTTLAFAQMWHVFNMRASLRDIVRNEITANAWIWIALAICLVLVLVAVFEPTVSAVLELTSPGAEGWLLISAASVVPLLFAPLVRRAAGTLSLYRRG